MQKFGPRSNMSEKGDSTFNVGVWQLILGVHPPKQSNNSLQLQCNFRLLRLHPTSLLVRHSKKLESYTTSAVLPYASELALPNSMDSLSPSEARLIWRGSSSCVVLFRGNIWILLLFHSIVVVVKVQMITSHIYGTKNTSLSGHQ